MKKIFYISLLSYITVLLFISCNKKDDNTPVYPSFDTFLNSQPNLTIFKAALEKAQLQTFRDGQGPFTWYAPTNEAFIAAKLTLDSLNRMTPGQVSYVLLYHLINPTSIPLKPVVTKDMIAQNSFARASQLGQNIYLGNYQDSFYVNGGSLLSTNNFISNGIVHSINSLNVPPTLRGNIQAILNTTGQHSLFIAALTRANRWVILGSTSIFTVIAPTDAAMTAAGYTPASIIASTVGSIDSLVRYHMFSGSRLFTNDFGNKISPGTFLSTTKRIQASNYGRSFKGLTNATAAPLSTANILGTNGVVHVIDGVLRF